jgi:hypothetical protein
MQEIAYTTFGRNSLFLGLLSHIAAILVVMMSASGTAQFFNIVFPASCLFLIIATHREFKHRGAHPFKQWLFYVAAVVTIVPLIGPILVSGILYGFQSSKNTKLVGMLGFVPALFRLRTNVLTGFALIMVFFILFILTIGRK